MYRFNFIIFYSRKYLQHTVYNKGIVSLRCVHESQSLYPGIRDRGWVADLSGALGPVVLGFYRD